MFLSCDKKVDVSGIYISKAPSQMEKIKLMYTNGDFNFLYTDSGNDTVKLNKDKTFLFSQLLCKAGDVKQEGMWSLEGDKLHLNFSDSTRNDINMIVGNGIIYFIDDIVVKDDVKIEKYLHLFRKQ